MIIERVQVTSSPLCLSVIIPTYNRKESLRKALEGYLRQTAGNRISEILIVDDGSTDGTASTVSAYADRLPLRYLRQVNQGPAAARNKGIHEARGTVVLFTDDDIIPAPDLVAEHLTAHEQNPDLFYAVLGYVTWSAEIEATPFMKWYGEKGALFDFAEARRRKQLDFRYFYTCNLSLKTVFLRKHGLFNPCFKSAAFEDTDLGYRLQRAGMRLFYAPSAVGYHDQQFDFELACRRGQRVAAAKSVFMEFEAGAFMFRRDSTLPHQVAKWLGGLAVPFLIPLKPLLDSRIPLPSVLYRILYWHYTNRRQESNRSRAASL